MREMGDSAVLALIGYLKFGDKGIKDSGEMGDRSRVVDEKWVIEAYFYTVFYGNGLS